MDRGIPPASQSESSQFSIRARRRQVAKGPTPPQNARPPASRRAAWQRMRRVCCGVIPASYSIRKQTALALRESPIGMVWDTFQTTLSLISCAIFVANGYGELMSTTSDFTFTILFTLDYLIRWYAAVDRAAYPFGFFPIIDMLTCVPVYVEVLATHDESSQLGFFRFVRVLRIMRVLRLFRALNASVGALQRQLMIIVLTLLSFVFLTAGLIIVLEGDLYEWQMGGPVPEDEATNRITTFGNAVYFLMVTLSTVGYGDLYPLTPLGKGLATIFIPLCIIVIPMQVNELSNIIAAQSKYAITYVPSALSSHVLVTGAVHNEIGLREFLHEMYHPERVAGMAQGGETAANRVTLVMGQQEPSDALRMLMLHPLLEDKLVYILGNGKDDDDLRRAGANVADASFLLSDVTSTEQDAEDRDTAFRAVLLRTHAPKLPMLIHGLSTEAVRCLDPDDINLTVLATDEVRARLLARASTIPGFSTFAMNLMRCRVLPADQSAELPLWQAEYVSGTGHNPAAGPIPAALDGLSFADVARMVYTLSDGEVVVLGVHELDSARGTRLSALRLDSLAAKCRCNALLASDMAKAQSAMGADASAAEALVPGSVLLNPGAMYRCRAGQVMYTICQNQHAAAYVFDNDNYADVILPAELPCEERSREDGYGFTDEYADSVAEGTNEMGMGADPPVAVASHASAGVGQSGLGLSSGMPASGPWRTPHLNLFGGLAAGASAQASSPSSSFFGPDLPGRDSHFVPVADLHDRYSELMRLLEVHDVRKLESPVVNHIIVVCPLAQAAGVVAPFRMRLGDARQIVLLVQQDHPSSSASSASRSSMSTISELKAVAEAVADLETLASGHDVHIVFGTIDDIGCLGRAGLSTAFSLVIFAKGHAMVDVDGERVDNDVVFGYRSVMRAVRMTPTQPGFYVVMELLCMTDIALLEIGTIARQGMGLHGEGEGGTGHSSNEMVDTALAAGENFWNRVSRSWRQALVEIRRMICGNTARRVNTGRLHNALEMHLTWVFLSPLYASGFVLPADSLHTLLVPALYTPAVMPLFSALLSPWPDGASSLQLEYVPVEYHGCEYSKLVEDMSRDHDVVVLGLYRCKKAAASSSLARAALAVQAAERRSGTGEDAAPASARAAEAFAAPAVPLPDILPAEWAGQVASFSYVLTHPTRRTLLYSDDDDGDMMYVLSRGDLTERLAGRGVRLPNPDQRESRVSRAFRPYDRASEGAHSSTDDS